MLAFAEPLALLFAGLYTVLIFFYLWERWRRRVAVPSLLLWESVREDVLRARRFRPDPLFLIQLLLLTCLIVALARPYLSTPVLAPAAARHIFLLDTSASMQAREAQHTRFEEAQAQAEAVLARLPSPAEVMVITTAPAPEVVLPFTRDRDEIRRTLRQLTPVDTGGDPSLALALAQGMWQHGDGGTGIELFTDVPRAQLAAPVRDTASIFPVGETDANLGIEALQVFQGRFQDYRQARASILVENFSHREAHGFLRVQLEEQVVSRNGFTLPPRASKSFVVQNFPGPGRLEARLESTDALPADDVAFGWIRALQPLRLLMVSTPSSLVEEVRELAAAVPALQLSVVDPAAFRVQQASQADVVIFHRVVPDAPIAANALYLYPPPGNRLFPIVGNAEDSEVLDWDAGHPALRSLQPLAALPIRRTRVVTPPAWGQTLLWSRDAQREFPLALAGSFDGHRVACIAFDLEGEHLLSTDRLNLFLFFTNLLAWLSPSADGPAVVRTGEFASFYDLPGGAVQVQDPRGAVLTLPADLPALQLRHAGEYRIRVDGSRRVLLANFFDPAESDIGRTPRESSPARPAAAPARAEAERSEQRHEYSSWIYAAALTLLLVEWVAYWRREE